MSRNKKNKIKHRSVSERILNIVVLVVIIGFSMACLYPLLLALAVSLSDESTVVLNGYKLIPEKFSLDAYRLTFQSLGKNILNAYKITLSVTALGTMLSLFVSSTYAYVLINKSFKPRGFLNLFLYIPMIFTAGLLPWYIVCTKYYHLNDKFYALLLPAALNVFNVFLLRNFFNSIPEELQEAAKIDGAGHLTIFAKIYMPLAKVGLVTVGLFYALNYWNDYYLSLMFINIQKLYPLQYYLYNMLSNIQFMSEQANQTLGYTVNIPTETVKMAVICITIGPIIMVYPFAQKYFTKGVIVGAVKG